MTALTFDIIGMMDRKDTEPIADEEIANMLRETPIMPTESMQRYWAANVSYSSGTISATSSTSISLDPSNLEANVPILQQQQQHLGHQQRNFQHQLRNFQHQLQMHDVEPRQTQEDMTMQEMNNVDHIGMNLPDLEHTALDQQWTHALDPSALSNGEFTMVPPNAVLQPNLGFNTPEPRLVDSSQVAASLSLQPWPGKFNFQRIVPTDNKDKNKWCYSTALEKLYVNSGVAVPVGIRLNSKLTNPTLRITPVYKQSQHFTEPVTRCHNCVYKSRSDDVTKDFICQVDGESADYIVSNGRHVVTLPLQAPAPGEDFTTILVKIMCLTSCVGGPNRKPFALSFELIYGGSIEGRQILDVKCCKCPSRDMSNDENSIVGHRGGKTAPKRGEDGEKSAKVRKLASELQVGEKKRKYPKIKPEPESEQPYVFVQCPRCFEEKVKEFINGLVLVSQAHPQDLYQA